MSRSDDGRTLAGDPVLSKRTVAILAGLTVVVRLPGLLTGNPFNSDETTLATGGRALADGGRLYVDVIDRKPPLPFALYRILDGFDVGHGLLVVRAVVAVLIFVTGVVVAREAGRRFGPSAALVAGVVVIAGTAALGVRDGQPANFEVISLLPIALAFCFGSRDRPIAAGIALAVATLCKQPAAVTAIPVAICLWRSGRWRSLGLAAGSGLVATVALAAPFGLGKVIEWSLLGTGGYLSLDPAGIGFAALRIGSLLAITAGFWGGAWLLALAPRTAAEPEIADPAGEPGADPAAAVVDGPASTSRDADLWWLLGVSALGVVAGFHFFPHYLIQLLPALGLLAGRGAVRRPTWVRPALAWGVAASLVGLATGLFHAFDATPRYEAGVAAVIRAHSCSGQRVLVWGNVPELYWRSGRLPAGGFTHTEFITGYSGGRQHDVTTEADVPDEQLYRDWLARIRRQRPAVFVDTAIADLRGGKDFPLVGYPTLDRYVVANYHVVDTIARVPIYVRNGADPGADCS